MYCFDGLKQASSNVDIACGMHVLAIFHRVTNDSVSRKQTFNCRSSISGQIFNNFDSLSDDYQHTNKPATDKRQIKKECSYTLIKGACPSVSSYSVIELVVDPAIVAIRVDSLI